MDEQIRLEINQHLVNLREIFPEVKSAAKDPYNQTLREPVIKFFKITLRVYQLGGGKELLNHSVDVITSIDEIATAHDNGKQIDDMLRIVDVNSTSIDYIPRSKDIVSRLYINNMDVETLGENFIRSMTHFINPQ